MSDVLKKEDYLEPDCLLSGKPVGAKPRQERIPEQRISEQLDELMAKKEFLQAENMLKYWIDEARVLNDRQGEFMVYNEMMGYYRKTGRKEEAYQAIEKAMAMLDELGYRDSISGATCYTNIGTVYTVFEEPERSLPYFEKAKEIYENTPYTGAFRLAGCYNNLATALTALGRGEEADAYYVKALNALEGGEGLQLEKAMTWLNRIDILLSDEGEKLDAERIEEYLEKAKDCLDDPAIPRDSYYSFVADKCLSIYDYFGYFRYANELRERIREIDERA